jgi:hypothetical protein
VAGPVVTPYANGSDPYAGGQHRGIDIAAPVGTPVVAAAGGLVTFAGPLGSSGLTVAIRTDDGFDTSYLHLSAASVGAGDRVATGAPIGRVGTTGRRSAVAPHLHFGVREAGSRFAYRDPLDFLPVVPSAPPQPAARPAPMTTPVRARTAPPLVPLAPVESRPWRGLPRPAPLPLGSLMPQTGSAPPGPALAPPGLPAPPRVRRAASPASVPAPVERGHSPRPVAPGRESAASLAVGSRTPAGRGPRRARSAVPLGGPAHDVGRPVANRLARAPSRRPLGTRHRGLDLGWLAACIGMVAAAAILGRPRATTRALRRTFDLPFAHPRRLP